MVLLRHADLSSTVSVALSAAEQALLSGDENKLYDALKAMGVHNLDPQNKGWYLKQLQADRESKEQVCHVGAFVLLECLGSVWTKF